MENSVSNPQKNGKIQCCVLPKWKIACQILKKMWRFRVWSCKKWKNSVSGVEKYGKIPCSVPTKMENSVSDPRQNGKIPCWVLQKIEKFRVRTCKISQKLIVQKLDWPKTGLFQNLIFSKFDWFQNMIYATLVARPATLRLLNTILNYVTITINYFSCLPPLLSGIWKSLLTWWVIDTESAGLWKLTLGRREICACVRSCVRSCVCVCVRA